MPRASSPTRLSDTKLPCTVAHASVVLSGGSIAHISGDKALLLCQEHSRTFSDRCCEDPIAMKQRRPSFSPLHRFIEHEIRSAETPATVHASPSGTPFVA